MRSPTSKLRRTAQLRDAISASRAGDIAAVCELLASPDLDVRKYAVGEVGRGDLADALPELLERLDSEDADVRAAITLVLVKRCDPTYRQVFVELLDDTSNDVRRLALRGLSGLNDPTVVDVAAEWYGAAGGLMMRQEALDALASAPDRRSEDVLKKLLSAESSWWWRRAIRKAIRCHGRVERTFDSRGER